MGTDAFHGRRQRWLGVATAAMCALAAGAVWCVLSLYVARNLTVLALPIALVVAWVLRNHGFARSGGGALLAAGFTAAACFYAQYLLATAHIASMLGLPMRTALAQIGPGMATAVMQSRIDGWDLAMMLGSVVAAALLVLRGR